MLRGKTNYINCISKHICTFLKRQKYFHYFFFRALGSDPNAIWKYRIKNNKSLMHAPIELGCVFCFMLFFFSLCIFKKWFVLTLTQFRLHFMQFKLIHWMWSHWSVMLKYKWIKLAYLQSVTIFINCHISSFFFFFKF